MVVADMEAAVEAMAEVVVTEEEEEIDMVVEEEEEGTGEEAGEGLPHLTTDDDLPHHTEADATPDLGAGPTHPVSYITAERTHNHVYIGLCIYIYDYIDRKGRR